MRNTLFKGAMPVVLVALLATVSTAQLSGAYTIDPAGTGTKNYKTIGAAVTALGAGVSGSVSFTLAPVTFKETVSFTPVTGASATNTITFVATGTPAVIDANGGQHAVTLADLCAHFVFDNLKITNFTGYGLYLNGLSASRKGVNLCTFKNLVVETNGTGSTSRCLYLTQSDSNTFYKCIFRGGYYVVYNSQSDKNVYDSCEMDAKDTGRYAAYFVNNNDSDNIVQNCFIHSVQNSTGAVCLQLQTSSSGNMIWNNTIICKTSGAAIKTSSGSWTNSCSIRNNIVVNLGTGIINEFWFWNTGTPPQNTITPTVVDHNCYYCPNNPNYLKIKPFPYTTITPPVPFAGGNLKAFQTWANNPANKVIRTGGATTYDVGSIEADPGLVSMVRPFDIHLKSSSPCLDAGTSKYPEAYQSISQSLTVAQDFEGDARGAKVDIGADEVGIKITGSGSGAIGTTLTFTLTASSDAGLPYQVGSSLGKGPIFIDTRQLDLALDNVLVISVSGFLPTVFQDYAGNLNASGVGTAKLHLPNITSLKGLRVYTAFVTIKVGAPSNLQSLSPSFMFTIQ